MTNLRVIIVDDEPLARERLRRLLGEVPGAAIVCECSNGAEAIVAIRKDRPDLVFLDVQMPEVDGFGVLAALQPSEHPAVIFTTAYDQFAVKAFEVHAVDYLLKPFDEDRLKAAVNRAQHALALQKPPAPNPKLQALLDEVKTGAEQADRISVKTNGRIVLIKVEDIDWVEAADNYVTLHVGKASHMIRETMTAMEARLQARKFLRVSRSTLVNIERVKELHPLFHGDFTLVLHDGSKLSASRNYREKIRQTFGV
ncbi:MAG: response regulator transcription factor [Verrucomicrobia bacterium]|nr:response regulator transcription factor [Verrucomicrobiota bacterium]